MPYRCCLYSLPAELEDSLVADLWDAGTLGVAVEPASGALQLTAYFPAAAQPFALSPALAGAGVVQVRDEEVPDTDWMAEYRRQARPFNLGSTLAIDPREPEDQAGDGEPVRREADGAAPLSRRLLRLPARTAFGIGSHESTALAIELVEAADLRGLEVLDVGTGTGILAFASLLGGAARAVAFDTDLAAVFQARANSRLNSLHPPLFAGRLAALSPRGAFDLAVVNVVPEEILPELEDLLSVLRPGAALILSGLLAERAPEVLDRLAATGWIETDRRHAGEWVALRLVSGQP
jgi:ribosomal protein L11 methyltransferase